MCIFAQPVASVSSTNIFGRLDGKGNQFVAYQMEYASASKNAMILPIPTKPGSSESSVEFINLEGYDSFFKHMDRAFPNPNPPKMAPSRGALVDSAVSNLAVHKVGNFVASMVPKLSDFSRLDPQFTIAPETWSKIPLYGDYSFVVFQLEELAGKPHPMAFRFPTRHKDQVFFPTVHIHDGEVHAREEFDHMLYCQDAVLDEKSGSYTRRSDRATGWTRSKDSASRSMQIEKSQQLVAGDLLLHRKRMRGLLQNKDVLVSVKSSDYPTIGWMSPSSLGNLSLAAAFGMTALPLAWIIRRRSLLMSRNNSPTD